MTARMLIVVLLTFGTQWAVAPATPAAEDVLDLVPESASGLLVINRMAATDAKFQAASQRMQIPMPGPLAMLKRASAVSEGLDESGTIALVTLPPVGGESMPTPLLFVPVSDYAKFIAQLHAEGEVHGVSPITVRNMPSLVRHVDGYAVLTDAGHRNVLEKLEPSAKASADVATWRKWVAEADMAFVVLRPGIKRFFTMAQQRLAAAKPAFANGPKQMQAMAAAFDMYGKMCATAEQQVSGFGVALRLDNQDALRLNSRTLLVPGGTWAEVVGKSRPVKENPLHGLPDGPFVVAGGGEVSEAFMAALMSFSTKTMTSMPSVYGITEEQAKKFGSVAPGASCHPRPIDGTGRRPRRRTALRPHVVHHARGRFAGIHDRL